MTYSAKQLAQGFPQRDAQRLREMLMLEEVFKAGFARVLKNPILNIDEKFTAIENILGKFCSKETLKFIKMIFRQNAQEKIPQIVSEYRNILNNLKIAIVVEVITAKEISKDEEINLENNLKKILKMEVILKSKIDPDLIGGTILIIGDQILDNSYQHKLALLR